MDSTSLQNFSYWPAETCGAQLSHSQEDTLGDFTF